MTEWYVNYTVRGKDFQAGPYKNVNDAWENYRDIVGYAFITDCYISCIRDKDRVLIGKSE
jgi:hypothetical protein